MCSDAVLTHAQHDGHSAGGRNAHTEGEGGRKGGGRQVSHPVGTQAGLLERVQAPSWTFLDRFCVFLSRYQQCLSAVLSMQSALKCTHPVWCSQGPSPTLSDWLLGLAAWGPAGHEPRGRTAHWPRLLTAASVLLFFSKNLHHALVGVFCSCGCILVGFWEIAHVCLQQPSSKLGEEFVFLCSFFDPVLKSHNQWSHLSFVYACLGYTG